MFRSVVTRRTRWILRLNNRAHVRTVLFAATALAAAPVMGPFRARLDVPLRR